MSKENRSVSDEDLKNVRGGIKGIGTVFEILREGEVPLYAVTDDEYKLLFFAEGGDPYKLTEWLESLDNIDYGELILEQNLRSDIEKMIVRALNKKVPEKLNHYIRSKKPK